MTDTLERVARAICDADPTAPDPDSPILIGMKTCKAWEGRVTVAEAAISVVHIEVRNAVRRAAQSYPDDLFPPESQRGQAGKIAPFVLDGVLKEIDAALSPRKRDA